ncbi:hypothetical protein [Methylorubrum populi]
MLSPADLAAAFPADVARRLQAAALHQDRCHRHAARLDLPEGFQATANAISEMGDHAASIAEGARLAGLVARFLADESSGRPAPAQPSPASSASPSGRSLIARTLAALTGAPSRNGAEG